MFMNFKIKDIVFLCGDLHQLHACSVVEALKETWPQFTYMVLSTSRMEADAELDIFEFAGSGLPTVHSLTLPDFLRLVNKWVYEQICFSLPNNFIIECNVHFVLLPRWFSHEAIKVDFNNSIEIFRNLLAKSLKQKYFIENCARIKDGYDPIVAVSYTDLHAFDEFIIRLRTNKEPSLKAFINQFQHSGRVFA